jgi:CheY-like chemotaxis protein
MEPGAQLRDVRLLIVDDDRAIRDFLSRTCEPWGYQTETASSAEIALVHLESERYNIILTDIRMGKMDGLSFAAKIREKMPSVAIVVMTGFPSAKTAKQSQELGAVYYLQKPISSRDLSETLRIASSWNLGMLAQRAAQRFLALKKVPEAERKNSLQQVKAEIRQFLAKTGSVKILRNFVYRPDFQNTTLFTELDKSFSGFSQKKRIETEILPAPKVRPEKPKAAAPRASGKPAPPKINPDDMKNLGDIEKWVAETFSDLSGKTG